MIHVLLSNINLTIKINSNILIFWIQKMQFVWNYENALSKQIDRHTSFYMENS